MMLLAGLVLFAGAVLVLFGLVMSGDGLERWHQRRAKTPELPNHRTERLTDEVVVRRRVTKERIL